MRDVWCNLCGRKIPAHGTTRVLGRIVFNFDAVCWRKRDICEALMRRVAGSNSGAKEVARVAGAQAAPASAGALPESFELFLAAMGEEVDVA